MPFANLIRPNPNATRAVSDWYARDLEQRRALEESGRDPFAEALQSAIPVNRATDVARQQGTLAGIAEMARGGLQMRGGFGDPIGSLLNRIKAIANKMDPKQAEDLAQAGAEAATRGMQQQSMSGKELTVASKNAMLSELRKRSGDLGRQSEMSAVKRALDQKGDKGELEQWAHVRKNHPGMSLDRFRRLKGGIGGRKMQSLDAPAAEGESRSLAEVLRNTDDPLQRAAISERLGKLTESQAKNLDAYLGGGQVHRQIIDRILKKLEVRPPSKPISGGAPTPLEDAAAEFPAHQFRLELRNQPSSMFGQEGPDFNKMTRGNLNLRELPKDLMDFEKRVATSGASGMLGSGTVPEEGFHLLNPVDVTEQWTKLRNMFKNVGQFQGRN